MERYIARRNFTCVAENLARICKYDEVFFDGATVEWRGVTFKHPPLVGAIQQGWLTLATKGERPGGPTAWDMILDDGFLC